MRKITCRASRAVRPLVRCSHGLSAVLRYASWLAFLSQKLMSYIHQVIRGSMPIRVECAPAFNYARSPHTTEILIDTSVASAAPTSPQGGHFKALFTSEEANLTLDLRYIAEASFDNIATPVVELHELDLSKKGHKGKGVYTEIVLTEGQAVTFVLRTPPNVKLPPQAQPTHQAAQELGIPFESE